MFGRYRESIVLSHVSEKKSILQVRSILRQRVEELVESLTNTLPWTSFQAATRIRRLFYDGNDNAVRFRRIFSLKLS